MKRRNLLGGLVAMALAPLALFQRKKEEPGDYRHTAMKGPLEIHEWGYDLNGKPVEDWEKEAVRHKALEKQTNYIKPSKEAAKKLADMLLKENIGDGKLDLIWGPDLEIKKIGPTYPLLNDIQDYEFTKEELEHIYKIGQQALEKLEKKLWAEVGTMDNWTAYDHVISSENAKQIYAEQRYNTEWITHISGRKLEKGEIDRILEVHNTASYKKVADIYHNRINGLLELGCDLDIARTKANTYLCLSDEKWKDIAGDIIGNERMKKKEQLALLDKELSKIRKF